MENDFKFDFDRWAALAKNDPEEFERQRTLEINATCKRIGGLNSEAVKGICWRIDMERQRSSSPLQLCIKLSALMWRRHTDLRNVLNEASGFIVHHRIHQSEIVNLVDYRS